MTRFKLTSAVLCGCEIAGSLFWAVLLQTNSHTPTGICVCQRLLNTAVVLLLQPLKNAHSQL